jgi:hypothetical protein
VGLGKPPIVTVGGRSVFDSGLARAAAPVAGVLEPFRGRCSRS